MILDASGRPISDSRKKIDDLCLQCGAGKEEKKPVLGGNMVCMKCGYIYEEKRYDSQIKSGHRADIS